MLAAPLKTESLSMLPMASAQAHVEFRLLGCPTDRIRSRSNNNSFDGTTTSHREAIGSQGLGFRAIGFRGLGFRAIGSWFHHLFRPLCLTSGFPRDSQTPLIKEYTLKGCCKGSIRDLWGLRFRGLRNLFIEEDTFRYNRNPSKISGILLH